MATPNWMGVLKFVAVVLVFGIAGALLYLAQTYVLAAKPVGHGPLVFANPPEWVNSELKAKLVATAGGDLFRLDGTTATLVAQNLSSVGWVDHDLRSFGRKADDQLPAIGTK